MRCQVTRIQMNPSFIFCFFIFLSNFISNLPELKAQVRFSVNNLFCRPNVCKFYYFQLLSRTIHQFRPILTQNIQSLLDERATPLSGGVSLKFMQICYILKKMFG